MTKDKGLLEEWRERYNTFTERYKKISHWTEEIEIDNERSEVEAELSDIISGDERLFDNAVSLLEFSRKIVSMWENEMIEGTEADEDQVLYRLVKDIREILEHIEGVR